MPAPAVRQTTVRVPTTTGGDVTLTSVKGKPELVQVNYQNYNGDDRVQFVIVRDDLQELARVFK